MNDFISRRDLYERIADLEADVKKKLLSTPRDSEAYIRYVERLNERSVFKHEINAATAVEVKEVVHGEWLDMNTKIFTEFGMMEVVLCSKCRCEIVLDSFGNFCPNCGADMRKKV